MRIALFLLILTSSISFGQNLTPKDNLINIVNSNGEKNGVWIEQEGIIRTISYYTNGKWKVVV